MNIFKSLLEKWRTMRSDTHRRRIEQSACELFQITEYQSGLWLTYNGNLFCPISLIKESSDDAVALVNTLRALYIQRNLNE